MEKMTRREAITLIGTAVGAVAAGKVALAAGGKEGPAANPATVSTQPHKPKTWPYEPLDPVQAAEKGYEGYFVGHCMYGGFVGVVGLLADKKGAPYNTFPFDMMTYGMGGVAGWATLCGALNGGAAAIQLLSTNPTPLIDELFNWYQAAQLPDYRPKNPKFDVAQSVSRSTLCHESVTNWCRATGLKAFSKERAERCAWVAASVAKKTAELLNQQHAGTFKAAYPIPESVQSCRNCHDLKGTLENTRGKMDCGPCHSMIGKNHPN